MLGGGRNETSNSTEVCLRAPSHVYQHAGAWDGPWEPLARLRDGHGSYITGDLGLELGARDERRKYCEKAKETQSFPYTLYPN